MQICLIYFILTRGSTTEELNGNWGWGWGGQSSGKNRNAPIQKLKILEE